MKAFLWKLFYTKWKYKKIVQKPGYSLLIMVPGDLPVFLKIALEVCSTQESKHMVEAVVVPDNMPSGFLEYFKSCQDKWKSCSIKLAKLNQLELFITKKLNNPHTNNWLQFIHGCNESSATHILWHDADLFIKSSDFFKKHYERCLELNAACFGVSEVWDKWYKENGFPYLTATWELMLNMDWVKSFKPWQHRGHDGIIGGKSHTFDITLLPQCLTKPERVRYQEHNENFVHFNYVIATYRHFQNTKGPFEDDGFKLLLVRLLINAFDDSNWEYEVPSISDLIKGLKDPNNRVTYISNSAKLNFKDFRIKFQQLIEINILNNDKKEILKDGIKKFDIHFSC